MKRWLRGIAFALVTAVTGACLSSEPTQPRDRTPEPTSHRDVPAASAAASAVAPRSEPITEDRLAAHSARLVDDPSRLILTWHEERDVRGRFVEYDPPTKSWTPWSATTTVAHRSVTTLSGGDVLATGNVPYAWDKTRLAEYLVGPWAERMDAKTKTFRPILSQVACKELFIACPSGGEIVALPNDQALVVGSFGSWLFDGATNRFSLIEKRYHADPIALRYPGGKAVVLAWDGRVEAPMDIAVRIYDGASASWTTLPPLPFPTAHPEMTVLRGGRIMVAGGAWDRKDVTAVAIWNPETSAWLRASDMSKAPQSIVELANGQVLACGAVVETFDPVNNRWTVERNGELSPAQAWFGKTLPTGETYLFQPWRDLFRQSETGSYRRVPLFPSP